MKRLLYIELKSGHGLHRGPAWIARVRASKTGQTVYFQGCALRRGNVSFAANHFDRESGHRFWISGVKKDGSDRHWAGTGPVQIEKGAVSEYLSTTARESLPPDFVVIEDFPETSIQALHEEANEKLVADR